MKKYKLLNQTQQDAITAIYESNKLLIAPMGAGKTVIAATAIQELLDNNILSRVLIVTTKQIAQNVWPNEFKSWEHTQHITCAVACGTPEQRLKIINNKNQVVVMTFGTIKWLIDNNLHKHFDGLLIDETDKVKKTSTQAVKVLRVKKVLNQFKWRCGLSGTPVGEALQDIYAQLLLIDGGVTLGRNFEKFTFNYFNVIRTKYNTKLIPHSDAIPRLLNDIKDVIHVISDNRQSDLPPLNWQTVEITMPHDLDQKYNEFKKTWLIDDVLAINQAALRQKMQQITCGFIYDTDNGIPIHYSDYRERALLSLIKKIGNTPIVIVYQYDVCLNRLLNILPNAVHLTSNNSIKIIPRWNKQEISFLIIHPRSAGHGLQLEQGGHTMIWYSPQYSNPAFQQTNARLWRTGQKQTVNIYELITVNSIDEGIINKVRVKESKHSDFKKHSELLNATS